MAAESSTQWVAAPRSEPPFEVDAVVEEEDTYLTLSAEAELRLPGEHPVRVLTEAHEAREEIPGTVVVRAGRPLTFLAVVHKLDEDPTWREEWVASALDEVAKEVDRRTLASIALPLLGAVHGKMAPEPSLALIRRALRRAPTLRRVWLIDASDSIFAGRRLETPNLVLRPSLPSDFQSLHLLWTHPEIRRYLFDDRELSRAEARELLARSTASFRDHGYGLWLFFERSLDAIAGFAGFLPSPEGEASLIFGTRPDLWGRGYAREAASEVLRYLFDVLGLVRVVADVVEPNAASVRVLARLGLVRTRRAVVRGRPLLYYELTRKPGTGGLE
jgi:ribosomal-protein-alanine N-acetyltransferase